MTKITHTLQTTKIKVDGFTPDWKNQLIKCHLVDGPLEIVTIQELHDTVTNENGEVDASFISPKGMHQQTITFSDYLNYEFVREGNEILANIISNRRALCQN